MTSRSREQGETLVAEKNFSAVIEKLVEAFHDRRLVRTLLEQTLSKQRTFKMDSLVKLTREVYLEGRTDVDQDPRFSLGTFYHDVWHIISEIQFKLVDLFSGQANSEGYMLVMNGQKVYWSKRAKEIERFIREGR